MSNVTIPNYAPPSPSDHFNFVWKLTRALKKAGWIYKASADGTAKDTTAAAGNDTWGGALDPLIDSMPALATGSWWCAQGPSTLKLPITAAITGSFVRGENVIQAVTGAEAEILGAVFDPGTSTGWVVLAPRVSGSGADPRGWDHAHAVTGALSGASFTPSSAAVEFVTETVFWRTDTTTTGSWYFQCVDKASEATSRFSYLAANAAGCTQSVAPGGGGAGNTFPTVGSWVPIGRGSTLGGREWMGSFDASVGAVGKVQLMVASATEAANVSADGSFLCAAGCPNINAGAFGGFGLQRLDDTEEGDVCPWVTIAPTSPPVSNAVYDGSSTGGSISTFLLKNIWTSNFSVGTNPSCTMFRSWRRRGMASDDTFVACGGASLAAWSSGSNATLLTNINPTDAERAACDPASYLIAEPVWVVSSTNLKKTRKGTLRWLLTVPTGNGCDLYANGRYVQLGNFDIGLGNTPFIGGPWDGVTTPVNA